MQNNIKLLREKNGYSQAELGGLVGKSQTAISLYEMGARQPSLKTAQKIAVALDTTIDALFLKPTISN